MRGPARILCRVEANLSRVTSPESSAAALPTASVADVLLHRRSWRLLSRGGLSSDVGMRRTALALHQLISTRFRGDDLSIITFGRHAQTVALGELVGLEGVYAQGTNLHHALLLAARHFRKHPSAQPVLLVVTDGEPTAQDWAELLGTINYEVVTSPRGRFVRSYRGGLQ